MKITNLDILNSVRNKGLKKFLPDKPRIAVGMGTCGIGNGADKVFESLETAVSKTKADAAVVKTGCFGFCAEEPLVNIYIPKKPLVILKRVTPKDCESIIENAAKNGVLLEKALCKIETWDHLTSETITYGKGFNGVPAWNEIPFYRWQKKIVMRNCGLINPEDIEEYIGVGGYFALWKTLKELKADKALFEVKKSKLRGRGGAGFPVGTKWELFKSAKSDKKYIVCNADEGDPGAYMNRNEIESDPHMLIEGMIIGAYATGASDGIIYVRKEYPLAVKRLKKTIEQAREFGLLGENILNSGFDFDINIVEGAGAFVCGEETALIASVEGKAGRAMPRPPFPAQKGIFGKPTNINNVESWCNIPVIIIKGGDWFTKTGTENNTGTKVFSLVGKIKNTGLVELPLGTSLKTTIEKIGEGSGSDRKIKAIQMGGPSGGCIPCSLMDTPVDYESLNALGAIMGSGGMVAMDENNCMVDVARYFLEFTVSESCGKCVPCREGLFQSLKILNAVTKGKASDKDLETLGMLGEIIKDTSLCGLGQTGPNPILTTLRYFKDEYEAHIKEKKCPAGICKALIRFIISEKCTGCLLCAKKCPVKAISGEAKKLHKIDPAKCIKCGVCREVCRFNAVEIK